MSAVPAAGEVHGVGHHRRSDLGAVDALEEEPHGGAIRLGQARLVLTAPRQTRLGEAELLQHVRDIGYVVEPRLR